MKESDFFIERAHRTLRSGRVSKIVHETVARKKGSAWGHTRTGARADLDGVVYRSGWESNVARIMKGYAIPFEFEPMVFTYPVVRGTKGYTPDFYLPDTKEWIEVKGYFDDRSRIKIKRFKKYYPEEFAQLTMIVGNAKASLALCETLGVPNVLLYPNLVAEYKSRLATWEN